MQEHENSDVGNGLDKRLDDSLAHYSNRSSYESLEQPNAEIIASNNRAYELITSKLGPITTKTNVLIDSTALGEGYLIHRPNNSGLDIVLAADIASANDTELLRSFKDRNPSASSEDFIDFVVVHEYGHIIDLTVPGYVDPKSVKEEDIAQSEHVAAGEAFAHWFSQFITGYEISMLDIKDTYADRADPDVLMSLYYNFGITEKMKGAQKVIENRNIFLQEIVSQAGAR